MSNKVYGSCVYLGDIDFNAKLNALGGVYGSKSSAGALVLNSTSHATKGKIEFGTSVYDEAKNFLGLGVGVGGEAYERLFLVDGNVYLQSASEQGVIIKRVSGSVGLGDPVLGPVNPVWQFGRIIASPPLYKAEWRLLYYDDDNAERAVFSAESTGTFAGIRLTNGSFFEGFIQGESVPWYRVNTGSGYTTYEAGPGGSTAVDAGLRRTAPSVWQMINPTSSALMTLDLARAYSSASTPLVLGASASTTHSLGTNDALVGGKLEVDGQTYFDGVVNFGANVIAQTDNTYDLGASGATRPRTGYFGTSVIAPSFVGALTGNADTATSAATLTTARNLWGQSFNGSANVTGDLTSVGNITGGASSMTVLAGTGASRTLTFQTTTSGSAATTALTLAADQSATFANTVNATTFVGALTGNASTATTLANSRTLWGQSFTGAANVTGSLTSVGDITGGASSMTILAGTGASRTLTFQTTTSGSTATTALTLNADQTATFGANISGTGAWTITGGAGNMTIVSGTGASRTMIFQTTTSGSTATTALTLGADQIATFAAAVKAPGSTAIGTLTVPSTGCVFSGNSDNNAYIRVGNNAGFLKLQDNNGNTPVGVGAVIPGGIQSVSGAQGVAWSNSTSNVNTLDTGLARDGVAGRVRPSNASSGYGHFALAAACLLIAGSGSPEGAVTAAVGSIYMRTDGGANTSHYIKESGSGNTGWVAK